VRYDRTIIGATAAWNAIRIFLCFVAGVFLVQFGRFFQKDDLGVFEGFKIPGRRRSGKLCVAAGIVLVAVGIIQAFMAGFRWIFD
jgi:hypothetical protein